MCSFETECFDGILTIYYLLKKEGRIYPRKTFTMKTCHVAGMSEVLDIINS